MKPPTESGRFYLWLLLVLAAGSSAMATLAWWHISVRDGIRPLDIPLTMLFAALFLWVAAGFWTATFGFVRHIAHVQTPLPAGADTSPAHDRPLPRTAVVVPVYNEDPGSVFAGVCAVYEELQQTTHAGAFDVFVLSDTTDPDIWLEEESAWAWARLRLHGASGLFYRRRPKNSGRKCGNISDFCQRWGGRYPYMVVLDADSLMTGATIVEMVRRMERNPGMGILQVPPLPVNRNSLLARLLQFSSQFYGAIFVSGYSLWAGNHGNYWGHNAIIRTRPFAECCGLPPLPGAPPLGGEVLSHDFVEAALMQRGGWSVAVADDLDGSYEECPTTLVDFAKREQRWCQGNLQHIRISISRRVRPVSRLHLAMGAMSFLASPLWALFLSMALIQAAFARRFHGDSPASPGHMNGAIWLFVITMLMLLLPRLWAILAAFNSHGRIDRFGGEGRALLSVLLETATSVVIAPILMLYHTLFVATTFMGHTVRWDTQRRSESRVTLQDALPAHALHTIAGLAAALLVQWTAPGLLPWMLPVLFGLVFSIPAAMLLGSRRIGLLLRRRGLLQIPEEIAPPPVIRRKRRHLADYLRATRHAPRAFIRAIADPALNALHVSLLPRPAAPALEASGDLGRLAQIAISGGPERLSRSERLAIASHPDAMRWLHQQAWQDWPLCDLQQCAAAGMGHAAEKPQDPGDSGC